MAQFVRKTMLGGFAETAGGQNDPECSHVLMDLEEYEGLCRYISEARDAVMQERNESAYALGVAKREAREALMQAKKEADERVQALRQRLEAEKAESAYQKSLNVNLLRINRERANAERGLRPKKERPGYIVLSSEEKYYSDRSDRKPRKVRLWETAMQSPYPAELPEDVMRRRLGDDLFSEEGGWLSAKLGITGAFPFDYERMRAEAAVNPEDPFFQGNVALTALQRLKRNYRSGYWEATIVHTKPLGDVPAELLPQRRKSAQGTRQDALSMRDSEKTLPDMEGCK